jgi:hypothetical protein
MNKIFIDYDLNGPRDNYEISLFVKSKKSNSWSEKLNAVSGDVGLNQSIGHNKKIIWDVFQEREDFIGDWMFGIEVISKNKTTTTTTTTTYLEPDEVVRNFLSAIDKREFKKAYKMQRIDRLGTLSSFCSKDGYGGTNKVILNEIKITSKKTNTSKVYADYKTYDPQNSNWEIKAEYSLSMVQQNWIITDFKNLYIKKIKK